MGVDGFPLLVHVWDAVHPPRIRAVFLHGISSHAGWYNRSCSYLASRGIEVHFLNRRGSGLNDTSRGDVDHWQRWIEDVAIYLQQVRGVTPIVLCGISWGGKLAAAVVRRHPDLINGLGLICPGIHSPYEPGPLKRLVLRMPVFRRMQARLVVIPLRSPALFTDNPQWQRFIAEDSLALRHITWRFAREDRRLSRYVRHAAPFLKCPLLLMLAGRDRIIDNERVRDFYLRAASTQKTLVEYRDAAHTLEFEADPQPYFNDLANWISAVGSPNAHSSP
jgi:alpha-beta hydrolase superfamily lysophospholipase